MQTTEVIPAEEVAVVKTKIEAMREQVLAIKVTSQEELTAVAEHIGNVKKMKKFVTQERDKYITPAKEIISKAKEQYDPYITACDEAEAILKSKAQTFMLEEKKKEDELKAKEIKKVETGYQKPETAAKKIEAIPEAKKTVDAGTSKLTMKMVRDYRIVDEKLIPDEYYKPRELDLVKIRKVALAGVSIPGVEIFEKPEMVSKAS
jgi:beta-phosphoglucomutase-like phosphatase (HAD superfamily)